jgi:hypothetical protein
VAGDNCWNINFSFAHSSLAGIKDFLSSNRFCDTTLSKAVGIVLLLLALLDIYFTVLYPCSGNSLTVGCTQVLG